MQLSQQLVQDIANYLATKPYAEVAQLLNRIIQETQVKEEEVLPPKVEEWQKKAKE